MTGSAAQIHQTTFRKHDDAFAVREDDVINLGLDLLPFVFFNTDDIDLVVKVTNVTNNRLIFHLNHMLMGDDVFVARCSHENVCLIRSVLHRYDFVAFHSGL